MVVRGKWVFIGFLACSIAVVVFGFAFVERWNERWAVMKKRVTELHTDARSRNLPRSVLRGQPVPGNAWDEYNILLNDARTWTEDVTLRALGQFLNSDPKADRALVDQMIAAHAGALDHLRKGAQRADGQYPYKWERGAEMEMPSLYAIRLVADLALAQAKIWLESGRTQEATDLLLDTLMFARDVGSNGPLLSALIGDAVYQRTFDELRRLLLSGKLTSKQLADLEKKLEIVDHDFPSLVPTMANDNLSLGMSALNESETGTTLNEWLQLNVRGGWRYGFSPRHMAVDAFEERDSHLRRQEDAASLAGVEARKEANAIQAAGEASSNPLTRMVMPSFGRSDEAHREVLTRLRLLRAATGFLGSGTFPQLADPFGSSLLHSQAGGKTKIWSVGQDGKDDGGPGVWTNLRGEKDIVLDIEK